MAIEIKSKLTFPGGVHPPEYKEITENCAIEVMPSPKQVSVLLGQHIGAICKPTVAKRDKVQAGQIVGDSDAFVSAPVHTPVTGTVKDISLQSHPVLGRALAILIETDPENDSGKSPSPDRFDKDYDIQQYSSEQICEITRKAGIIGMGGAGFPTRVKIEPNPRLPKDLLIINGCECEPFITCDYRLMVEWTWQVLTGIRLAAKAARIERIKIGIEDNKPDAIEAMRQSVNESGQADKIEVVVVRTKYPQGGERQLIRSLLRKHVPSGGIPPMIGVCVLNIATCAALAEAVVCGAPLTHRVVTVTGNAIDRPGNYYVPIGTTIADLIDFCGGLTERAAKVVLGGPMMGFAIADLSRPITKTCGALTFLSQEMITKAKYDRRVTPCIRCGRCLTVCPENLNPTKIAHAVKKNRLDLAEQYYMSACIECGCCSFICPANIELTGYIKTGKILQARAKKKIPE
ncbi:MAG: electron transport complex subunit RsxC [Sedimentisphaerales bacterium]|nr:electron transport complex subunit RsxC [Sedimentisphaerales bacterium]